MSWWFQVKRADPWAVMIADRHYNRQKPGTPQFVPPGRCLVLYHPHDALWVTSWPYAKYVRHDWAGAMVNSLFRNEESGRLSSELIQEAVAHTVAHAAVYPTWAVDPLPEQGFVSFIDSDKVRRKRDPGRCYRKAGWHHVGYTKAGLWVYQLPLSEFPGGNPAFHRPAVWQCA